MKLLWIAAYTYWIFVHLKPVHWMACIQKRFKLQCWRNVICRVILCRCCPLLIFLFEINCFKNIYLSGVRVECQTVWIQIMPGIFSLIWVQAVSKFNRQIFDVVGSKYGVFFCIQDEFNLRTGVFPQFVIFKFIVDTRLPNLLSPRSFKKAKGILYLPPSVLPSVCPSVHYAFSS